MKTSLLAFSIFTLVALASTQHSLAGESCCKGDLSKKFEKKSCDSSGQSGDSKAKCESYAKQAGQQAAELRKKADGMDEMASKKSGEEAELTKAMAKTLRNQADVKDQMASAISNGDKEKCTTLQKECEALSADARKIQSRHEEMMKSAQKKSEKKSDQ